MHLIIPKNYNPVLNLRDTEIAIKLVKDFFRDGVSPRAEPDPCVRADYGHARQRSERQPERRRTTGIL